MVAAAAVTILAYIIYFVNLVWGETAPNRWSWLIWSGATLIEALTFNEVSGDSLQGSIFFISSACCFIITLAIWVRSKWKWPSFWELVCLVASAAALVLWLHYGLTLIAHLVMVAAVPVAFIPTWLAASADARKEKTSAWMIWTVGDALTLWLILSRLKEFDELPFIIMELLCHAGTWLLISYLLTRSPKQRT